MAINEGFLNGTIFDSVTNAPVSGAAVSAYLVSKFGSAPSQGSAVPGGSPDAGPITSGTGFGCVGAYSFTGIPVGDYYVVGTIGGVNYWQGPQSAVALQTINLQLFGFASAILGSPPSVTSGKFLVQGGTTVQNLASSGQTISFPNAFPTGLLYVFVSNGDSLNGGGDSVTLALSSTDLTHFGVTWLDPSGGGIVGTPSRRCTWFAIGW